MSSLFSVRVAQNDPFAWWLTRERIGRDLRERYPAAQELSPRLLKLVRKLDGAESNRKRLRRDAKRKRYFRKDPKRSR